MDIGLKPDRAALGEGEKPAYVHTLSLRLTTNQYRRLRRFVMDQEDKLGHRLTHQAVLEAALYEFLERKAAATAPH